MRPAIRKAIKRLEAASSNMKTVLKREQDKCKHSIIIQSNFRSGEYFGPFKGRRLCLECGLEEECGSFWDNDAGYRILKSNGFHKVVASEEIYASRFPEAEVDIKK